MCDECELQKIELAKKIEGLECQLQKMDLEIKRLDRRVGAIVEAMKGREWHAARRNRRPVEKRTQAPFLDLHLDDEMKSIEKINTIYEQRVPLRRWFERLPPYDKGLRPLRKRSNKEERNWILNALVDWFGEVVARISSFTTPYCPTS